MTLRTGTDINGPHPAPQPTCAGHRPNINAAALLAVLVLASACGQSKTMTLPAAPPDQFDTEAPIQVHVAPSVAARHGMIVGGSSQGAAVGMAAGVGAALGAGVASGSSRGMAAGILLTPVFALGGALIGAAAARTEAEAQAASAAIEQVYQDTALLAGLGGTIKEGFTARGFPQDAPCTPARARVAAARGAAIGTGCEPGQTNTLRLEVNYHFRTSGDAFTPALILGIEVTGMASSPERPQSRSYRWAYVSTPLDFFAATAVGAAQLRQEVQRGQSLLGGRIVDDLAVSRQPARVTGMYYPDRSGTNFILPPVPPGTAQRLPLTAQTINIQPSAFDK